MHSSETVPSSERSVVARVVWPWDDPAPLPPPRRPWRRALLQVAWLAGLGWLFLSVFGWRTSGRVLLGLAALFLFLSLAAPRGYTALTGGIGRLAAWIGEGINILVLGPFFFLVFPIGRLALVLRGRDPMGRRCPAPDWTTFWTPRGPARDPSFYRRQH